MKYVNRKAMIIRDSGRSSDFITPSFGYGCLYKCNYCYMRRNNKKRLTIASNTNEILDTIARHLWLLKWPKIPNQTHKTYYTYDFSCNEDYVLHARYHEWEKLFDYFKHEPKAMGTAATKYVNKKLLDYNANRKVRIRFSIMPQVLADKLEPNTSKIVDRIKAVNNFYEAGYDVHLNYSPIIMYDDFVKDYCENFINHIKPHAIFLSGGANPGRIPERDKTEFAMINYAEQKKLPLLAICRGMQMLVKEAGSSLSKIDGHVATRHPLIQKDDTLPLPKQVNSYHNWGITKQSLSGELLPFAKATDGTIEGYVHRNHKVGGIMWHPERESSPLKSDCEMIKRHFGI